MNFTLDDYLVRLKAEYIAAVSSSPVNLSYCDYIVAYLGGQTNYNARSSSVSFIAWFADGTQPAELQIILDAYFNSRAKDSGSWFSLYAVLYDYYQFIPIDRRKFLSRDLDLFGIGSWFTYAKGPKVGEVQQIRKAT